MPYTDSANNSSPRSPMKLQYRGKKQSSGHEEQVSDAISISQESFPHEVGILELEGDMLG